MKTITINYNSKIIDAMTILEKTGEKCLIVIDKKGILQGTITDGDIRRNLLKGLKKNNSITKLYNSDPIYFIEGKFDLSELKKVILNHKLDLVPIVDNNKKLINYVTWKDLLKNNYKKKYNKIKNLPIVIIAGGKGKRMGILSKILPKPLLPVNERSLLENIMEYFYLFGINDFYITLNYKSELIKAFFSSITKFKIKFIKEKKYLGTAGSLKLLPNFKSKNFLISNCDVIFSFDLSEAVKKHNKNKNDITLIVTKEIIKLPYGVCLFDNEEKLINIEEKPEFSNLINTGMYIIKSDVINFIKNNENIDMNVLLKRVINNKKRVGKFEISYSEWIDYGDASKLYKNLNFESI